MKQFLAIGLTISVSVYGLFHFITYLYPSEIGLSILSVAGIITLVFSSIYLPLKANVVPVFLVTISFVIQLATGGSLKDFITEGILQMRSIIAFLLVVPIISWVLREESYIKEIMNVSHKLLNTDRKFYFGTMIVNQIIACFLLFGAIPMMYQVVNEFLRGKTGEAWEYFKGTALLRSFSLNTLWVISIPSFAVAVDYLNAPLGWTIVQGFFISLAGLFLSVWFATYRGKKYGVNITAGINEEFDKLDHQSTENSKQIVSEFVVLFVSLFSTVIILHILLGWGLLIIIPPIIIIWTCVYFLLKKRTPQLYAQVKLYFGKEMKYKSQQFSLILSAGILIFSVNQSGLGTSFVDGLLYVEEVVPFINFLVILPFTTVILGFLGLGPLTVIVLVAGIVQNVSLPYPPELIVLSMTSGSVISVLLSPVILPIIVLSASNGLSILKNGFTFNFTYAVTFYFIVQLYIQFMWYVAY